MTSPTARRLPGVALDVLSDIEGAESELLCWGMVDGSFTWDELIDLIQSRIEEALQKLKDVGGEELASDFLESLGQATKKKGERRP